MSSQTCPAQDMEGLPPMALRGLLGWASRNPWRVCLRRHTVSDVLTGKPHFLRGRGVSDHAWLAVQAEDEPVLHQ